ncbi:MAG: hypothetical protein Salg2KO_15670 [Salibacteraceae bacterium]
MVDPCALYVLIMDFIDPDAVRLLSTNVALHCDHPRRDMLDRVRIDNNRFMVILVYCFNTIHAR